MGKYTDNTTGDASKHYYYTSELKQANLTHYSDYSHAPSHMFQIVELSQYENFNSRQNLKL